ncbi:DUF4279 domain-containing protein [Solihabitans fulvus]|uniref:DUF4279 domain-containing protein n=1 Tax=Solihabitans fulvus TaxID=1892852 RepID=A0A5B2WLX4_9PSEU|nr:DUF4279 domain-containing protein [Solihabitans fulvus]KAA2252435.1 DUF4279 domain-containing protein [Solihabitans fulvus]
MHTLQHCYFALKCTTVSAAEITDRLGLQPDEVMVLGSKLPEQQVPRCHAWKIVRQSTESVGDQIQHLVDRLSPVHTRLFDLVAESEVDPVMQVVRYFHHQQGVQALLDGFPPMPHAHRPLGWSLPLPVLDFLSSARCELDVDEYDLSDEGVGNSAHGSPATG